MAQIAVAPSLPSETDATFARETSRLLASRAGTSTPLSVRLVRSSKGGKEQTLSIPAPAVNMLVRILDEMAQGNAITLTPVHAGLTTQEAADLLSISRPSLIQLLDKGKIEYRKVGTHRRVQFLSLLVCKKLVHSERLAVLNELAAYDQELGIFYAEESLMA